MAALEKPRSLKRKNNAGAVSRKKLRIASTTDDLPWKKSVRPLETGLGDDGILELEEVEGVEIVYEETEGGKVAKFRVVDHVEVSSNTNDAVNVNDDEVEEEESYSPAEQINFDSSLLPEWVPYYLHPQLLHVLHQKGFTKPTPIQKAVIPVASTNKDIVGVAQTGSGKTLAYGLPILHHLLSQPRPHPKRRRPVRALILAPVRELALQVSAHLNECLNSVSSTKEEEVEDNADSKKDTKRKEKAKGKGKEKENIPAKKPPPHVSVAAIVGGMSSQKQRRILDRGVDVLVATPGRLWDIIQNDDVLAKEIKELRFLVLDEADRMIEAGHFVELENILRLTLRENIEDMIPVEFEAISDDNEEKKKIEKPDKTDNLQTFVLSATLSKDLQRNLKKRSRPKPIKNRKNRDEKPATTLDDLLLRLDFRDPEPEIIDLSTDSKVVSTLQEAKIECLTNDKDVYLYYFLLRHPGRSLVFLGSIDGIRRLMPLLELLNIKAFPLHSQLEQRQRLKNLDRFKTIPNAVLLATDIAARGLDIPVVDHVIHFQIPRTADTYIHRSGRTARAMNKGFSMLMIGPEERRVVRALMGSLSRDESDIPELSIELDLLDKLKKRVQLARQIEQKQHKIKKENYEKNWLKETAEVLGVELDEDISDDEGQQTNWRLKTAEMKRANLKAELKQLLSQPLMTRGFSAKYITSGSKSIVDDLLSGDTNDTMLGLRKADAGSELVLRKKKKKVDTTTKKVATGLKDADVKEESEEEWGGISV